MRSSQEFRKGLVVVAAVALVTGACSNMPSWSDVKLPTMSTFIPTNANAFNQASVNTAKPVTAADYIDAQGACAAASAASSGGEQETSARSVSLDMTECQVVQALGAPEATDIATNARGERAVTLTYLRGERAGLYWFVRGRLVSVERAPGAAEPERPARQPAKKQAKKPEPS
jgi:hypothetical protein